MNVYKLPIVALASVCLTSPALGAGKVLISESFDDAAFGSRGWYDNTAVQVTTSRYVDGSSGSAVFRFRQGATTPDSGGGARHKFAGTDRVYLRYWVRYSDNWQGSNKSYHPHEFYLLTNKDGEWSGLAETHLTVYIEQNEGRMRYALQDSKNIDASRVNQNLVGISENRAVAGCNGDPDGFKGGCYSWAGVWRNDKNIDADVVSFQDEAGPSYKGNWHKVEALVKLNSVVNGKSLNDGVVKYWVDGKLILDHSNLVMRTAAHADMKFNQLILGPYIGDGSPVDQTFWVDELMLANDVIGGGAPPKAPMLLEVK